MLTAVREKQYEKAVFVTINRGMTPNLRTYGAAVKYFVTLQLLLLTLYQYYGNL